MHKQIRRETKFNQSLNTQRIRKWEDSKGDGDLQMKRTKLEKMRIRGREGRKEVRRNEKGQAFAGGQK